MHCWQMIIASFFTFIIVPLFFQTRLVNATLSIVCLIAQIVYVIYRKRLITSRTTKHFHMGRQIHVYLAAVIYVLTCSTLQLCKFLHEIKEQCYSIWQWLIYMYSCYAKTSMFAQVCGANHICSTRYRYDGSIGMIQVIS